MPKFGQAEFAEFLVEMFMKNKLDKILKLWYYVKMRKGIYEN